MLIIQAIILGVVQGLTEFIPVSSSGHLILVPRLFGWHDMGLSFDVALHLGTIVAVIVYFRRDWKSIISGFCAHIFRRVPYDKDRAETASHRLAGGRPAVGRLMIPILVACVPAAVVGYLWDDVIEQTLREGYWVGGALVLIGLVMLLAERAGKRQREIGQMNYVDYLAIGCAQAIALFPGVSRSGITISAGLFRGLDRAAAARFSFLMSTPIILGAGMLKLKDALETGLPAGEVTAFIVGFITAALVGYGAIRFLMNYLRTRTLAVFVVYRLCLAGVIASVFLLRAS